MKRTKMFLGGGGFLLGLLLLWVFVITIKDWRNNGDLMLKNQIEKTGRIIAYALKEKNAFPRDYIYSDVKQTISPIEEWYDQIKITYETVYRNMEFDITTNLVYGLKVKYLTPCGEITPLND